MVRVRETVTVLPRWNVAAALLVWVAVTVIPNCDAVADVAGWDAAGVIVWGAVDGGDPGP
jgi:hypothetical protein